MRRTVSVAVLVLLGLVVIGLWAEKRTHPKGRSSSPVAGHDPVAIEYRYGLVRVTCPGGLATGLHGTDIPAEPFIADEVPDGVGPAHVEISFEGFVISGPCVSVPAAIDVYPAADFDAAVFGTPDQNLPLKELTLLQEMLAGPAGRGSSNAATAGFMPFMPVAADAGQVVAAKVERLEGAGVRGLRYLTAYSQEVAPIVEGQLFYTFQGLTTDGRYYVAASFPLQSGFLPTALPEGFDIAHFLRETAAYRHETTNTLEARPADGFTPPLARLDALVESITVGAN